MNEKLEKISKEEIAKLPKENQEAINSSGWMKICSDIGEKHLLLENEVNDLQTETLLVLTGIEDASLLATHLENNLGLTRAEAEKLARDVTEKILLPISSAIEEKIKNNSKSEDAAWHQNVNFIISGGDYSHFIQKPEDEKSKQ